MGWLDKLMNNDKSDHGPLFGTAPPASARDLKQYQEQGGCGCSKHGKQRRSK